MLMGIAIMLGLIVIAMAYRSQAKQAEHFAAIQKTIAEAALSQTQHREALDKTLSTLEQKQRKETIDETNPKNLAKRDGLDNDWSDADRLHDDTADASDHPDSATITDTASAALDKRTRIDLFGR
jgi:type II secretory pathway pseudopilin PulG